MEELCTLMEAQLTSLTARLITTQLTLMVEFFTPDRQT